MKRCEPLSTYPRIYDLIHATNIESLIKDPASAKNKCNLIDLMVELDRILLLEGTVVVRDTPEVIERVVRVAHEIKWKPSI
ncbi:probable pectin methyltransferase QUA3 [Vigna umbellata]|uniref:probable pectin methyltransferase QUA3 n=1 Tax=Vigna umbellata TaxID=87088 RepID=UPI001F5E957C|nr:probable pectin methyltransferase QUA3 [Vigna umbellata]